MAALSLALQSDAMNPLDVVEQALLTRDWPYDRPSEEELFAEVQGHWCDLRFWCSWRPEASALVITCAFNAKIPERHRAPIYELLSLVNERLWFGHFDLGQEDGMLTFRHTLLSVAIDDIHDKLVEAVVDGAVRECERFFPAFQSVLWANKTPKDAMTHAVFDTVGEA